MKKYVLIFLTCLFCCQLSGFAEGTVHTTFAEVSISGDTTIVVRECFNDCELYGDKKPDNSKFYGGEENWFEYWMKPINCSTYSYITRTLEKGLFINLKLNDLKQDTLAFSFYKRKYTERQGWCPDAASIYQLIVIKKPTPNEQIDQQLKENKDNNNGNDGRQKSKNSKPILSLGDHDITLPELLGCIAVLAVAVAVICLFVLIFVRINTLSKKIDRSSTDVRTNGHESGISSIDINKVITGSDIQRYIQEIVPKSIEYYIQSRKPVSEYSVAEIKEDILTQVKSEIQTIIAGQIEDCLQNRQSVSEQPAVEKPSQISEIKQPEFRTTKVQYYPDSNSFIISENSQNEIFELYSENGEYYYTIVNDPVLRKEMLGILPSYRQCIEIRQDSPTISDVEVIRDGRLIKNGDVYNIDPGCVLQLSLK